MTTFTQLCKEQRSTIEYLVNQRRNFTFIGNAINKDRTSVAKEIKRNRYIKSYHYSEYDSKGIEKAVNCCELLTKPPYVCNGCPNKHKCTKNKLFYNANIANEHALEILHESRLGADITLDEIETIERTIVPLLKNKKQSVNQLYINHPEAFPISKVTFYKYIADNILSLCNLDLPKKVTYKPRNTGKDTESKRKDAAIKGRRYKDYETFTNEYPDYSIVEMDTVIGLVDSNKVLLTLIIKKTNFMIIRLLDKKNMLSVDTEIIEIKNKLGNELYSKIFRVILTDNGCEFYNPLKFEMNYETGDRITNLFYCDPYCFWQKGTVEKNHVFIREVIPKKTNLDNFTEQQIKVLEDNINNIPRDILGGKTPYEKTLELYPEFIERMDAKWMHPDSVDRSYLHFLNNK